MRIALVAPLVTNIAQPYVGGAQALLADLAQGLVRRQHTVTLFARAGSFLPNVPIEQIAVPASVQPASFARPLLERSVDAGFLAQANIFLDLFLQLQLRHDEFDLLHAHAFDWPALACSTLIHGMPVIHTLHLPAVSPEINHALQILDRQKHPLTLITVSHTCAQSYAPYTPFDHVIYNGLDLDAIPFSAQISANAPLLFAGRITPEKGVESAIKIAQLAHRHLLIAGGIYDRDYYEQRVAPKIQQSAGHVTYLGQLEHGALWDIMRQSAALLFPIEWDEPFGLAAVEAMATGTPVIAFRRGAAEEVICHGETGFLVEPGEHALAAAQVDHLADLSRTHCRTYVETRFSLERMLDQYEAVYSALVEKA